MTNLNRPPKIYSMPKEKKATIFPKIFKIILGGFFLLIVIIYIIIFSPLFKIKQVEIIGGQNLAKTSEFLNQFKNDNIFLVNTEKIKDELMKNTSDVAEIKIYRGIPSTLRIEFQDRNAAGVWESNQKKYLFDQTGYAFRETEKLDKKLIRVIDNKNIVPEVPGQLVTENFVNFIQQIAQKSDSYEIKIDHFEINETIFQLDVITDKKIKIIFDTTRNVTDQLDAYALLIKDKNNEVTEYIDLRVEGKVYYK